MAKKHKLTKLVIYEGNNEVIICAKKDEAKMLHDYFTGGIGDRVLEEYDRTKSNQGSVVVSTRCTVDVY